MKYKLQDLIKLKTQGVNTTTDNVKYSDKGYKIVQAKNIEQYNVTFDEKNFIDEETFKRMKENHILHKGEVLFTNIGSQLGNCAIYNSDEKAIITWNVMKLIPDDSKVLKEYLCYLLNHNSKKIKQLNSSSTMPFVSGKELMNFEFEVPNIEIQEKVIKILFAINNKIKIDNQLIDSLYEVGKNYYNHYFKQYTFTENLKDSELGYIPQEYEVKSLSEVTNNNRNKVNNDTEYKVLSAVKTGNLELSEEYFNKSVPSEKLNKYIIVKQDDFAYNPARINIGSIGRNKFSFKTCVSPVYVSFSVEDNYKYFWDFYFKDAKFNEEVIKRASGSVRQTLKYDDFGLIKVAYPNKEIIEEFNKIYVLIDNNIKHINEEIETLMELRDMILPKLLNGEIDLEKINKE